MSFLELKNALRFGILFIELAWSLRYLYAAVLTVFNSTENTAVGRALALLLCSEQPGLHSASPNVQVS